MSAPDGDLGSVGLRQRIFNLVAGVGLRVGGGDAGFGEGLKGTISLGLLGKWMVADLVSRQGSEEIDCPVKVVYDLLLRVVVGIAVSLQGTDTRAVFVPLMFPEIRVVTPKILPEVAHVVQ